MINKTKLFSNESDDYKTVSPFHFFRIVHVDYELKKYNIKCGETLVWYIYSRRSTRVLILESFVMESVTRVNFSELPATKLRKSW
jgi:hypothetical protein